jgi:glycosyltransferase involved in cell wall biosynthesis
MSPAAPQIGAVLIGRNEGERLVAALAAAREQGLRMVYVDSGSTDGSVAAAAAVGAAVVDLDLSTPFTAARARNEGFARLLEDGPVDYVQFIDGDCILQPGWIETARAFLDEIRRWASSTGAGASGFPRPASTTGSATGNGTCRPEKCAPAGGMR